MSIETHGSRLFRHRGVILFAVALIALALASPSVGSVVVGSCLLLLGISLRAWAFVYLGAVGRTLDPACPQQRVVGGPFGWFSHPVYASNILIATALVLAAAPGPLRSLLLMVPVILLYFALGARERLQLRDVTEKRSAPQLSLSELARSERSTWLQLVAFMVALVWQF